MMNIYSTAIIPSIPVSQSRSNYTTIFGTLKTPLNTLNTPPLSTVLVNNIAIASRPDSIFRRRATPAWHGFRPLGARDQRSNLPLASRFVWVAVPRLRRRAAEILTAS